MNEVSLKGITKSYGAHLAIPPLDLDIPKGKFVTLLGPSGCGKTTTLRIIAGLEQPSDGELTLAGTSVFSGRDSHFVPPEKRGLGFIFQSYALWPNMKVDRNITLALQQARKPKHEIQARLGEALQKVQLEGYQDRFPSELSGGQQQRVAVARLIAARNSILLMDEPLSNLDAVLRTEMRTELKRLSRDLGATTIYVTHDQVEALTMSDIIVVMKDGVIQQMGSPYEIYHQPSNLFVAEFIGDPRINLFDGILEQREGRSVLHIGETEIKLPHTLTQPSGPVRLAIRPERLTLHGGPVVNSLPAEVDVVQPTGSQTILSLTSQGNMVTALIPRFVERWPTRKVWLELDAEHIMVFDNQSGKLLQTTGATRQENAA
ncbi:ABC transporter ATP-binding protein [Agrobacterium sp. rho-13.3]|uniref:ABC transporter ATP-binding protein n=1 Tax=Agrobacterium sp. rho-13.3 TaxID=3072980 RepID=UPI002A106447|nr:ABC transporter ATP-binding protein [Agrobacterium sp. rho-13.3]MDX8306784.1 ABC transporter ATP-binding protein [Agrobacterium sp. rho-13.3]MDX8306885.1 ABC transporter ATP-binding protein [Agrobacterium sp. rho-13.3]